MPVPEEKLQELRRIARDVRVDILKMLHAAGSGHTGGSLSAVELLVSLYYGKLRHRPADPAWIDRDRFVLSKGHGVPALYAVMAHAGYFPRSELMGLRQIGSRLQGHPSRIDLPGIEMSTGSLGQGLSAAHGMALGLRLDGRDSRVYALLGDGEIQEGMVWEAAMSAAHRRSDNLCAIIDRNRIQLDGFVDRIKGLDPLPEKWRAFGWHVLEIDGHRFEEILPALDEAERVKGRPTVLVAKTVKGHGVSIFADNPKYHGVSPTDEELAAALKELGV
jgi:transketolase